MANGDSYNFMAGSGIIVSGGASSAGMIKVGGLESKYGDDLVLIDNVLIGKCDSGSPKDALGDNHAFYIYGKTFKQAQIEGTIYMSCSASSKNQSKAVKQITAWFDKNRVSKSKKAVKVSLLSTTTFLVYIMDLHFTNPDPKLNSIKFVISGYTTPS